MPDPEWLLSPDESGFYGRQYYEKYLIEEFGFPSLPERARTDLSERCLYWLRTLLRYRLPPGRVLELGSAHGGFVAMLRWAGFDAIGLEVSPWLVEFAKRAFDVPVLLGPIEQQDLEPASFDVIAAMDLIEHLPDPVRTLKRCVDLLKPDGLLLIQTPCFPEGKTHGQLVEDKNPFLSMMISPNHLFLFSRRSLTRLLADLGLNYVQFEPNLFPYDMFLIARRQPVAVHVWEQVLHGMEQTPANRLLRAFLDLDDRLRELKTRYAEAEADRAARLQVIERQGRQLGELEAGRKRIEDALRQTQLRLAAVEAERDGLRQALARAQADLQASQQTQAELNQRIADLHQRLGAAEADRGTIARELEEVRGELQTTRLHLTTVQVRLSELEMRLAAAQTAKNSALETLSQLSHVLQRLSRSYVYRIMRTVSLWNWLADGIALVHGMNRTESCPKVRQDNGR